MSDEIEELQAILQNDPYNFQARRTLSIALLDNGFNLEAKQNLLYLVRTFPDNAELLYNLGIAYEKLGEFEKAERAYLRAIVISPENDFYYNLGITYIEMKEWGKAIVALKHVVDTEQDDSNTFFNLGLCFFNQEEYDVAIPYFQRTIELNPQDIFAHFYLGNIYKELGQADMAIQEYQAVLEITPDYSWAYFNIGSIAYEMGNTEAALQYLMQTVIHNPHDIQAYLIMVQIYITQMRMQEAMDVIQHALEGHPANGDLLYTLSQIFKLNGDTGNYFKYLESAIDNRGSLTFPFENIQREYAKLKAEIEATGGFEQVDSPEDYDDEQPVDEETQQEGFQDEYQEGAEPQEDTQEEYQEPSQEYYEEDEDEELSQTDRMLQGLDEDDEEEFEQ